jgi:Domain of unknown function (DUF5666)
MKKLTIISIVVILLAVSVVPAMAAGGPPAGRGSGSGICTGDQAGYGIQNSYGSKTGYRSQSGYGIRNPYALSGTITSINTESHTVTVLIACGNRLADPYDGQEVTLSTTASTRFLQRSADGTVTPISFEELASGQTVSSHGSLVDGVWTASRITSGALLSCIQ